MSGLWTATKLIMVAPLTHGIDGQELNNQCYLFELAGLMTTGNILPATLLDIPKEEFFWDEDGFKEDTEMNITISNGKHSCTVHHTVFKGTKFRVRHLYNEDAKPYLQDLTATEREFLELTKSTKAEKEKV